MGVHTIKKALLSLFFASIFSRTICASGEFSIVGFDPSDISSEFRVAEIFEHWRKKLGKVYGNLEEREKRLESFRRNLAYVIQRNSNRPSVGHFVGLNAFADLSNEEFRAIYLSRIRKPLRKNKMMKRTVRTDGKAGNCDAPDSLDWREKGVVTGVKDQGSCGSCWAFSSTGAMEGINAIETGNLISLSEQELIDCDSTNDGCDGGYMDYAFEWVKQNGGIDSETDYPYTGEGGTCNTTKEDTKVVSIDGYEDVAESDSALLCAVVNQPISVGMDGSAIDFQLYTGGIYDGSCSSNPDDIDHAVLIVGYSSEEDVDYWIVKNSWGTDWGVDGYFYIRRNTDLKYGVCAINAMASYPTKESNSSTVSPPPPPPSVSPPPPPPSVSPPPPPPPSPSQCGDYSYCSSGETCCCILELSGYCLSYGCCEYENAVCCTGTAYCCPQDYPVCDVEEGLCLQNYGDLVGVPATKQKLAKRKFPWTKFEATAATSQPHLKWKRDRFATFR